MRTDVRQALTRARDVVSPLWKARAEILTASALLAGWALLTHGIALLTTPKVWPLSAGLLLLSLCGYRLLWAIASHGLYMLALKDVKDGRRG